MEFDELVRLETDDILSDLPNPTDEDRRKANVLAMAMVTGDATLLSQEPNE